MYGFLETERKGERETERKKNTSICCSSYLFIHSLILVCALTEDQTHNLGVLEERSNQLSNWPGLFLES